MEDDLRPTRAAALPALIAATLLVSATACQFGGDEAAGSEEIIIGADLELSGATASVGEAYQRALQLRVNQINASGALGNRKLKLDVKDNRSDSVQSLRNVGEFADDPNLAAIIMGSCGSCAVDAAPTVNEKKIPTIALAPAGEVVNPLNQRRWLFKLAPNAADSAVALTDELETARVKTVGLLHTDDSYGREGKTSLESALSRAGIQVAASRAIKITDTDVTQPVKSLVDQDPDAIVVWTFADQASLAATTASQAGFKGKLYFDAAAAGNLFLGEQARAANGAVMVFTQTMVIDDVIATTPAKAARKQWFRDYTAQYGSYNGFASFAADAVQMVADALAKSPTVDRDSMRNILETTQFDGLSGPIRMTPDNHSGLMPQALTVLVARGGRWRLAG